jgi:tetratricopeptide (TPR) repeat protein
MLFRHSRRLRIFLLCVLLAATATAAGVPLWAKHELGAAEQAFKNNRLAEARVHIQRYLRVWSNSVPAHFLAGRIARRQMDFESAANHFKRCGEQEGWSRPLADEFALMRVQQGDLEGNEQYFQREVANGNPNSALFLEAFVEGYMRLDRLVDVNACLLRWQQLEEDNMYFYLLRGSIRERIPNVRAAGEDYSKVLELNPDFDEARLRLVRILLAGHKAEEALGHALRLRERLPGNPEVPVLLARCYFETGEPERARPLLAEALEHDPANQPALLASARLFIQDGDLERAESCLRQARAIDPHSLEVLFVLAQCLRERGKEAEADQIQAAFKQIESDWTTLHDIRTRKIGASPDDPDLRYQGAIILIRLGEVKEGIEWLKRALALNPNHEPSRKALAAYFREVGEPSAADSIPSVPGSSRAAGEHAMLMPR